MPISTKPRKAGALLSACAALAVSLMTASVAKADATTMDLSHFQVIAPPSIGWPMSATIMPLKESGFEEHEFFIKGRTNRYRIADPMRDAELVDGNHPYETRVLVRRPTDPTKFNGTVVVEWLNVTLDQDVDFVFGATRELLVRDGYAWIGVSAQHNGVDSMKRWNADRYRTLDVSASNSDPKGGELDSADPSIMAKGGDVLAWDIYSQVGKIARESAPTLLGGLKVKRVISASESQSTLKVSTYYNTIQPLHGVYDGFLFYDRSGALRTDLPAKTIAIGTEIFTALLGYAPQDDNDHQRWWEINGASHFSLDEIANYVDPFVKRDAAFRDASGQALDLSTLTKINGPCTPDTIYSRVPNGDVMKAALKSLDRWIAGGKAPSTAPRFVVDGQARPQYVRDANGQILGGIRTAAMDVPRASNAGIGKGPWFCGPSGYHIDFTPAQMCERYGSHNAYVDRVAAVANANVRDGYILPEEAAKTITDARALTFSCTP